jgi:hypothetical protein
MKCPNISVLGGYIKAEVNTIYYPRSCPGSKYHTIWYVVFISLHSSQVISKQIPNKLLMVFLARDQLQAVSRRPPQAACRQELTLLPALTNAGV